MATKQKAKPISTSKAAAVLKEAAVANGSKKNGKKKAGKKGKGGNK